MKEKYRFMFFWLVLFFSNLTNAQYIPFQHDGITREYLYYEPTNLNELRPLVLVMHGLTGDADSIRGYSQMDQFADEYGFAVCYPRGTLDSNGYRFWNVGYSFHQNETVDDVGFITDLAEYLQETHGLNPEFTFATGMSNGAEMCYMLACQSYNTFKAIAPVSGMILQHILDECDNSSPIPVFEIHGTEDNTTPISGDPNNDDGWGAYPSIPFTIESFAEKNQCTSVAIDTLPNTETSDNSYIVGEKHVNGINHNEVWLYKVVGGGHDWPGGWGNMDIQAGEEAWLFFQKYIDTNTMVLSSLSSVTLERGIRIFPNPANNLIHIESNNSLEIDQITLINDYGIRTNVKLIDGKIDVTHLKTGIYYLKIKTSKGVITKKIRLN